MEQPPGTPHGEWIPRNDASTRKVIDRLIAVESQLTNITSKMEELVSWKALVPMLGGASVIVIGAVWMLNGRTEDRASAEAKAAVAAATVVASESKAAAEEAKTKTEKHEQLHQAELQKLRSEMMQGFIHVQNAVITGRRQPQLEQMAADQP